MDSNFAVWNRGDYSIGRGAYQSPALVPEHDPATRIIRCIIAFAGDDHLTAFDTGTWKNIFNPPVIHICHDVLSNFFLALFSRPLSGRKSYATRHLMSII